MANDTGNVRVLLVDDSPVFLEAARQLLSYFSRLEVLGYVRSGSEALAMLDALNPGPELILADIVMPGMSGFELTGRIRERGAPVKIVLISTYNALEFDAAARHAGADGFVRKDNLRGWLADAYGENPAGGGNSQMDPTDDTSSSSQELRSE